MTLSRSRLALLLLAAFACANTLAAPAQVAAPMPVIDASVLAKDVEIAATAAEQLRNGASQLTNLESILGNIQNLNLANGQHPMTPAQWTEVQRSIALIQQTNTISNDRAGLNIAILNAFQSDYPMFHSGPSYAQQYQTETTNAIQAQAQALSIANTADANSTTVNAQLQTLSNNPPQQGHIDAELGQLIQLMTIAVQEINQVNELQIASMKAMSAYYATRLNTNASQQEQEIENDPYAIMEQWAGVTPAPTLAP